MPGGGKGAETGVEDTGDMSKATGVAPAAGLDEKAGVGDTGGAAARTGVIGDVAFDGDKSF
jgi:hypothetical protein